MTEKIDVLIVGLGNLILGDEGVGVHAARRLAKEDLPDRVAVLDGGSGGFHLLGPLTDADCLIIMDAALDDQPPGTVQHIRPRYASDYPSSLSAHDIGLKDMLEAIHLLDGQVETDLFTVSIETPKTLSLDLTPPVQSGMDELIHQVKRCLASRCKNAMSQ